MQRPGHVRYPVGVFPPISYLDFAQRWFGQVRYDLASSGLRPIPAAELGEAPADDYTARRRFAAAVARRYGVPAAEVAPCLGGSGALFVAFATLSGPGGRVLVEAPGYEPMWRVPEALGIAVDRFERLRDDGYALDPERVLAALRPDTRLVAITNPHNPTAALVGDDALRELAHALAPRGVGLLVDEAYLELARPAHSARHLGPNVVTCSSTTKCWGVPWARAGWLLMPEPEAREARRIEQHVCGTAPPASWAWGELALESVDALVARRERLQIGKRQLVESFVERHAALEWHAPHPASLYGWLRDRNGRDLLPLIEAGIAERGVIVSPGAFFGDPAAFRMSWTSDLETLGVGLLELARALRLD